MPGKMQVNQLQFKHIIAGEIKIIMNSPNMDEVHCRLRLIQKLAHWKLQSSEWSKVRNAYTAILNAIEEGEMS